MKKKLINLCILFLWLFFTGNLLPQDYCGTTEISTVPILNDIGGYLKPERTDKSNGQNYDGTFKMLFVFVQFQGENPVPPSYEWPIGQPPIYKDQLFSENKLYTGNYWDRYSDQNQFFSDYYMEVSRGILDVTGITRNIILDHTASEYRDIPELGGYNGMLSEIYYKLSHDQVQPIDWESLDRWRRNNTTGLFEGIADSYIDMIGLFFRTNPVAGLFIHDAAGYVPLFGPEYSLPNNKKIGPNRDQYGSGFLSLGWSNSPNSKLRNFGIAIHEIGHYLFANNHSSSGLMTSRGGISINDFFYSGFERMKLGYVDATTVDFNQVEYQLDDVSGRDGTSNLMLKVPISPTEFFLIENRRKISQYDIYMLGDTAGYNQLIDAGDKGKGIYIYHAMEGYDYAGNVDLECADGLWNWSANGYTTPDWDLSQQMPIIARTSIPNPLNNDDSYWDFGTHLINRDGVSACYRDYNDPNYPLYGIFFTSGKRHTQVGQLGTVIKYTNTPDWYTSRELWGDRFDAWNLEYNKIFSPYSNPNTKDKNNSQTGTGIYIYYHGLTNNKTDISIYKVGEPPGNPRSDADILALTPPSKPMGLKEIDCVYFNGQFRPRITWNHNTETDMVRTINHIEYKRYNIWRVFSNNMNILPDELNYTFLAYRDIPVNETPTFVDETLISACYLPDNAPCPPSCWIIYPIRYKVEAVDADDMISVKSDYMQALGARVESGGSGGTDSDNPKAINYNNDNIPKTYSLEQNYPNPFNPVTNIRFSIKEQNFVTLKIYDITGREIKTLVNEVKSPGEYIISFDGSDFASGIYFFKITAGDFVSVKKMMLIK